MTDAQPMEERACNTCEEVDWESDPRPCGEPHQGQCCERLRHTGTLSDAAQNELLRSSLDAANTRAQLAEKLAVVQAHYADLERLNFDITHRAQLAEEKLSKMREALRKYGAHLSKGDFPDVEDCWYDERRNVPCNCGLRALLSEGDQTLASPPDVVPMEK